MTKIKTSREIAEMLVSRYLQANSVASVGGITATLNNWVSQIKAQVLREEAASQLVSEEELCRLAGIWGSTRIDGNPGLNGAPHEFNYDQDAEHGYKAGFRKACEMRATVDIKARWPSEDECERARWHELAKIVSGDPYGNSWTACFHWIKERLGV